MTPSDIFVLAALFFVVAVFYSAVGHAGASGYLAVMALMGLAPDVMRPTALLLNIVVAAFTTWRFREARFFNGRALLPFVAFSVPCAFLGGALKLPVLWYQAIVGAMLLVSAAYLVWRAFGNFARADDGSVRAPLAASLLLGAGIGLLSGLTGTGGGIFLSPIILFMGWAGPKSTAGLAAPFIMINSIAGLAGSSFTAQDLPEAMFLFAGTALAGAFAGTWLGIKRLSTRGLLITLAVVMTIAAAKLISRAL